MEVSALHAVRSYSFARPGTQAEPEPGPNLVKTVFSSFEQSLQAAENQAQAAMTGDADPHALVQALAQSELAVETAVTVRNKVVEAYQEILRMPI